MPVVRFVLNRPRAEGGLEDAVWSGVLDHIADHFRMDSGDYGVVFVWGGDASSKEVVYCREEL